MTQPFVQDVQDFVAVTVTLHRRHNTMLRQISRRRQSPLQICEIVDPRRPAIVCLLCV
jgi:hypothetical protein